MSLMTQIKSITPPQEWQEGEKLCEQGLVREVRVTAAQAQVEVQDTYQHSILFDGTTRPVCTCREFYRSGGCRHLAAAVMLMEKNGILGRMQRLRAVSGSGSLLRAADISFGREGNTQLELTLLLTQTAQHEDATVTLRIGRERLYVVRDIAEFLTRWRSGEPLIFGKSFTWTPATMTFSAADEELLRLLEAAIDTERAYRRDRPPIGRAVRLSSYFLSALLTALREVPFILERGGERLKVERIRQLVLPVHFRVTGNAREAEVAGYLTNGFRPLTADCAFVQVDSQVVETDPRQRPILRALWEKQLDGRALFAYDTKQIPRLMSAVVPALQLTCAVELEPRLRAVLVERPLTSRVYLDRAGDRITATVIFSYEGTELNPFDEQRADSQLLPDGKLLLRDVAGEQEVLRVLREAGFAVRDSLLMLSRPDAIFAFLTGGTDTLSACAEVYASNDFKTLTPRRPQLSGHMALRGGRLSLMLGEPGLDTPELRAIMDALARRRSYFRLRDGSYLDLTGMEAWEPVADALRDAAQQGDLSEERGGLSLASYRAFWLSALLDHNQLPVTQENSVRETVAALDGSQPLAISLPEGLSLRPYQERGFQWLYTLDSLHMGGVLADDMGLGKTVQVIALLKAVRASGQTALVVAPTSLTYNWLSEINRFAPELSAVVLSGTVPQREALIRHIREAGDIDVLITSYPLIRRDIDLMADIPFRLLIADEAQQVKNAGSLSAGALRRIQAQSRFALTGTPMENGTGELWSIFDLVLPGYLGTYHSFLRRWQGETDVSGLRERIRPFLMRRLKRDVLTELPDKLETTLTAEMTPEQAQVYQASAQRLRQRVDRAIEAGRGRGRIDVLAAMTELRQICCHPALVLPRYTGTSGKLALLMDILPGALAEGRRILLFSQFTSMLKLMQHQLESAGISCMYLDGATPAGERLQLCNRFNAGDGELFLISLKAGGMGLNLTGADMVIHYDPWWNPAAEDQATDRAYRIGQTHNVDVIRLVTHATIEEQVVALGDEKRALFDQLITAGEELVTALSNQEIRKLFE